MDNQNSRLTSQLPGSEPKILKPLAPSTRSESGVKSVLLPALIILAIILAGSATGYFLSNRNITTFNGDRVVSGDKAVSTKTEAGLKDEKSFPDKAQGKLELNDSESVSEGSHKLVRPGGPSQAAYLTSSAIDLSQFLGKCVEVWGETFSAQKASWLLDVGYIKILDKCPEGL